MKRKIKEAPKQPDSATRDQIKTAVSLSAFSAGLSSAGDAEPMPDIAICSTCGWKGPVIECEKGQDGSWEEGYYDIDLCPKCDDGGCVDDYDMTADRSLEWIKWDKERAR
jgi:hypothetical protein